MARFKGREVSIISVKFEEPKVKIQHEDGSFEIVDQGGLILTREEMATSFKGLKEWGGSLEERNRHSTDLYLDENPTADEKTLVVEKPVDKNLEKNNARKQEMNKNAKVAAPVKQAPGVLPRNPAVVTPVNPPKAPVK